MTTERIARPVWLEGVASQGSTGPFNGEQPALWIARLDDIVLAHSPDQAAVQQVLAAPHRRVAYFTTDSTSAKPEKERLRQDMVAAPIDGESHYFMTLPGLHRLLFRKRGHHVAGDIGQSVRGYLMGASSPGLAIIGQELGQQEQNSIVDALTPTEKKPNYGALPWLGRRTRGIAFPHAQGAVREFDMVPVPGGYLARGTYVPEKEVHAFIRQQVDASAGDYPVEFRMAPNDPQRHGNLSIVKNHVKQHYAGR